MSDEPIRATSFDVAALAGVSQSAVSRAFTPGSSIRESTRLKILEAARKLNYVPNSIASSLTKSRSKMVAVILGTLENPFYVRTLQLFSQELQKRGRQTLTFTLSDDIQADEAILRVLQYQVEAVILTSAQLSTRMINLCHDRGIPIVLFNRYVPHSEIYGVRCDNVGGGRLIADALLQAGARSFLMVTGDPNGTTSQDRVRGFLERILEAGIRRSDVFDYPGGSSYEGGMSAIDAHMATGKPMPDAVFGIADIMAMGAIDALRGHHGLRVPEDVMVAGFDGIPEAAREPYRLTTVQQPLADMVQGTLSLLSLDEPRQPYDLGRDRPLPGQLIWRGTIPRGET